MEPITFRIGHLVEIYTHDIVLCPQVHTIATKRSHFERTPDHQVNRFFPRSFGPNRITTPFAILAFNM